MDLTTKAGVELLLNPDGSAPATGTETLIDALIDAVSAAAEKYLNRQTQAASTTEYLDVAPYQRVWSLKAFPVTAVTSVSFDPDQSWGSGTALTAGTDYQSPLYEPRGLLTTWAPLGGGIYNRALKVIYTGGMAADVTAFVSAYPDIGLAMGQQVAFLWQRRKDMGASTLSSDFGTVTVPPVGLWLPVVRSVLDQHRRVPLAS